MPHSPAQPDLRPVSHGGDEGERDPSADGPAQADESFDETADENAGETADETADATTGETADEDQPGFGAQQPTRFAADVEYRGRAWGHDYLVQVRHRFLDTSATVVIDGVEHDPQAEEKALKAAERAVEKKVTEKSAEPADPEPAGAKPADPEPAGAKPADPEPAGAKPAAEKLADAEPAGDGRADAERAVEEPGAEQAASADDLRFRCEEGFSSLSITVRRPDSDGEHADAEVIKVCTVGLGGAGEVDVRRSFGRVLLVPAHGTPSAVREEKRTAHPTRYALLTALMKSARYLIPLLGLGAIFSGVLDPLRDWVEERVRPAVAAIAAFLSPIWDWLSELTRPVREFLAALLRPVTEFRDWLMELLFGWIPEFSLPFSIPEWVADVAVPVTLVLTVFVTTFLELRRRGKRLEATRNASDKNEDEPAGASQKGVATLEEESQEEGAEPEDGSSTAPPRPER